MKTILFLLICSGSALGQIAPSIYFDFGKSRLNKTSKARIDSVSSQLDTEFIDSIHFIGFADTVGNTNFNLDLALKRAERVQKHFISSYGNQVITRVSSLGETQRTQSPEKSRRVDIVVFKTAVDTLQLDKGKLVNVHGKTQCHQIDYSLLHDCTSEDFVKRKINYTKIISEDRRLYKNRRYYTAHLEPSGKVSIKRIRWKYETTGRLWWKKKRNTAILLKEDYEQFKVFTIQKPPCDSCSEDFLKNINSINQDTCLQTDRFLNKNIQVKRKWFNPNHIKIRAPKEYVRLNETYFVGCDDSFTIDWYAKKRKKHLPYYYAEISRNQLYMANITRKMPCCKANPEPSLCEKRLLPPCQLGVGIHKWAKSWILEAGHHYSNETHIPYLQTGLNMTKNSALFSALIGTNIYLDLYASSRFQLSLFYVPIRIKKSLNGWVSPFNTSSSIYCSPFVGTELKHQSSQFETNYFEHNLHLGLNFFNSRIQRRIPRLFIQASYGIDYLKRIKVSPFFVLQAGLNIRIR